MTSVSKTLSNIFSDCKNWIARNPSKVRTWETRIFLIADVLIGRFNNTKLKAEWLRSAYRLISLFNGLIILHSSTQKKYNSSEKVNICVAVLEHCEIAIEKTAEEQWGKEGKLDIIKYLQIMKFLAKMTLVLHFKEKIIGHPCAELESIRENTSNPYSHPTSQYIDSQTTSDNVLKLKTSGRVMRTVASAPPLYNRLWKSPPDSVSMHRSDAEEKILQAVGEMLYVVKPIVNLALIRKFGSRSWKQWTCSLFLDLLSLHLIQFSLVRQNKQAKLTPVERSIITRRHMDLLLYIIRSPFFQSRVSNVLYLLLYMIPFFGASLSEEARFYFSSYFFLWSK